MPGKAADIRSRQGVPKRRPVRRDHHRIGTFRLGLRDDPVVDCSIAQDMLRRNIFQQMRPGKSIQEGLARNLKRPGLVVP